MIPMTSLKASLGTLAAALLAMTITGCDSPEEPAPVTATETVAESGIVITEWQEQSRTEFEQAAASWQQALVTLEQPPSEESLKQARTALAGWYATFGKQALLLNARACQLDQQALLARMDSWPLYPGYIDAMPQWPESGLISDPYLEMDSKTLRLQHGATDPAEASLGLSAMLVVLNGSDETAKALSYFQGEENNAPRRRLYLKLAGEQLLADYQALLSETPVLSGDLDCALSRMLERHQQLADSAANDEELVIPQTVRQELSALLLQSLQQLPESAGSAWEQTRTGILDAIAASKKAGWQAITDLQDKKAPDA